jgi:hypothetical protein
MTILPPMVMRRQLAEVREELAKLDALETETA